MRVHGKGTVIFVEGNVIASECEAIHRRKNMPSTQKFRDYVVAQFKGELRVTTRKMMGEYILYADAKIFGGIYDDRLLVKPVPAALKMLPTAKKQLPYDGAKPMLRITAEQIEDSAFLAKLLDAMLPELPAPKKK